MRFAKGHGTENDFVILLDPDGRAGLTGDLAARLCDRRAGIGGDGVLRVVRTAAMTEADQPSRYGAGPAGGEPAPEWFMDYRNADGTLAEMCGNGIRVFARYLAEHGLADGKEFTVATRSGPRRVRLEAPASAVGNGGTGGPGQAGWAGGVTVEMGEVAVLGPGSTAISGQTCEGLRISVGNPHLACLVGAPLASFDLSQQPGLDPGQFPEGGNVELVTLTGPRSVAMRVHERGSGETRSCGTGAVAAAAAAATATGLGDGSWSVAVPGGELTVTLAGGRAWLTGPAVIVAEGDLDPAWLAAG
jgi:diaminopimelate epimerase